LLSGKNTMGWILWIREVEMAPVVAVGDAHQHTKIRGRAQQGKKS